MRATRLLVSFLALALLGLVPAGVSASAAQPSSDSIAARSTLSAPVSARVTKLTAKIVKRKGKLILTGVVRPARGPLVIQRGTKCNAKRGTYNFKKFTRTKVDKKGRYTVRVFAPNNGSLAWRATKGKAKSEIWLTCRKAAGSSCPIP